MYTAKFQAYLTSIGFTQEEILEGLEEDVFTFLVGDDSLPKVKYILTPSDNDIFNYHKKLWNRNSDTVFIAVSETKSYIINAREKPDSERVLKPSVCIQSFDYGINSEGYVDIDIEKITKDYVSSSYFFDFVSQNQKRGQEVDKDLLLNLLALRSDLLEEGNEKIINLLILRCLFLKYLEDRGIFEGGYLVNILRSSNTALLIEAFDEIGKINSDVFKFDKFQTSDIKLFYLQCIANFFETDYRSGQGTFFPYQFDQIPIQLISHVYEAFLKSDTRKGRGIYYTPSFLVNFMLSHSLSERLKTNINIKVLDPAVGSAAFLVESFRVISAAHGDSINFETKKLILEQQLFGIDIDKDALQIAAFSLYLVLLETESPEFIRHEIKFAHPILPTLIGKTLLFGNSITDYLFDNDTFDFIISNPPWGSVPNSKELSCKLERAAIDNKQGNFPEYEYVADYERSQAFLMRVARWANKDTTLAMVVKNSVFLNDNTKNFRKAFLNKYSIERFFELSHYNKILFKKKEIGSINNEKIEVGASEPCVVIIFKNIIAPDNIFSYISPRLTDFAEHFNVIHYIEREIIKVSQKEIINEDNLWRILVNSDLEGFALIENVLLPQAKAKVEARAGFQPKSGMRSLGPPIWRTKIEPTDFSQFHLKTEKLSQFDWNQDLHRKRNESIYNGPRIIFAVRPLKSDGILFRGLYLDKPYVYKDNILSVKIKNPSTSSYVNNYLPYLGIINSKLIGFLFYQLSAQWGKGEGKRDTFRNTDVEKLPIKLVDKHYEDVLTKCVERLQNFKEIETFDLFNNENNSLNKKQQLLDDLNSAVFNLYELTEYDKAIVNEFYEIETARADRKVNKVSKADIKRYAKNFEEVFSLILGSTSSLKFHYYISKNIGAVVSITISRENTNSEPVEDVNLHVLNFVKSRQISSIEAFNVLNEGKVKLYDKNCFYIIKSNFFRDWTSRQALKDAKEEVQSFVGHLLNNNDH